MWGSDTSQQELRPTHRPSVSACGCEFDHELQFYLVARDASLFRRQLCGPIFFVGVSTHDCLITMVALSYLPALALSPVLERLLFTR
jgi:hypothetical protein